MSQDQEPNGITSRRDFLRVAGMGALALGGGAGAAAAAASEPARPAAGAAGAAGPYNILFLLTDQERFFRPGELPAAARGSPGGR